MTTRSALEPTDWYMLPMSVFSGWLTGAEFQLTVIRALLTPVRGSSVASL